MYVKTGEKPVHRFYILSLAAKGGRVRRFRVPGSKIILRVVVSRVSGGALTRLLHMGDVRDAPCCFLHAFHQFIF